MLKIQADPTFTSKVTVPTPNGPVDIKVEFKHMDADEYEEFINNEANKARSNEASIMDIAVGWSGVDGEFTSENITKVCKQYHQAARAIVEKWVKDLTQAKVEN